MAAALLALAAAASVAHEPLPAEQSPFLRGMVVSCPRWGPVWGSPDMRDSLADLKELGVEWVAIHPYAWIRKDGEVRFRAADSEEMSFLGRAVELARDAGVDLFWKPHLGYWGSFAWRGEIEFGDDEKAWRRFFDGYREFIVDQARFAESAGVDLFAVGVETEATTGREAEWRRIIAAVREVYSGRITYAANWSSIDRVPFWDAVDWIGVHAYFPLADGEDPTRETLFAGWDRHLAALERLSESQGGKPILFAEIGYNRNPGAAREPWEHATRDSEASRALRGRLIEVALQRVESSPAIAGMFWWKWIPGFDLYDRDFSMKDAEARRALVKSWGSGSADAPVSTAGASSSSN